MKIMRKITRKGWIRKLDDVVREIVKARHPYCVVCGSGERLEPGHVFTRKYYSTRWDLENVWTQCHNCNLKHVQDTYPFFNWFVKTHGQGKFDTLHKRFLETKPVKTWELEELHKLLLDKHLTTVL